MQQFANHSELLLKLDLQQFAEDDMILPDDFEMPSDSVESVDDTTQTEPTDQVDSFEEAPTEEVTEPVEQPQMVKLKYNHQEEEVTLDEAIQLAQMGRNYPKLQEKLQALESDPRLSLVEELASQQGLSVDEYVNAVRQYQERAQLDELIQQNIPEEYAREMLENKRFRQEFEAQQKAKQQEEQQQQEFADFFKYYREANGKDFNPETDQIPESVWQANQQGVPLRYAYAEHENNQLRQQLATLKKNQDNARKAPVSGVTAHGSNETASEDPFLKGFNSF